MLLEFQVTMRPESTLPPTSVKVVAACAVWPTVSAGLSVTATVATGAGVSGETFTFAEPVSEFVEYLESRPCSIEVGKPCVNCGVCEARGF